MHNLNTSAHRQMRTWVRFLGLLTLVILILDNVTYVTSGAVQNQTIVHIGSGEVAPGNTITVPIEVWDVENLASVEVEIRYAPTVLAFIACSPDPNDAFDLALCEKFDDDGVNPDSIRFTTVSVAGVPGNIILAEITFEAGGQPGNCSALEVEVFTLDDTNGNLIPHSVEDGQICISGGAITVVKELVGQSSASDWQFNGTNPIGNFTLPANGGQLSFALSPGSYTITEMPRDGYTPSVRCTSDDSGTSSVTVNLDADENITCTFTNTLVPPTLTAPPTNTPMFTPTPSTRVFLPLVFHQVCLELLATTPLTGNHSDFNVIQACKTKGSLSATITGGSATATPMMSPDLGNPPAAGVKKPQRAAFPKTSTDIDPR